MRADATLMLSDVQARIAAYGDDLPLIITGAAGSGKTTGLAARAATRPGGKGTLVICPNAASSEAFRRALAERGAPESVEVDALEGHLARWMREEFVSSGASPDLAVGGDADSCALARTAGRAVLDMSWPGFRTANFTLDLPFLGRPEVFFDEASGLFRQLRRWGVTPEEFESGCADGIAEFYGDDVERARALCADPQVRSKASSRGRQALLADVGKLRTQKRAERDLAKLLGYLYREYRAAARGARILCAEDVIDEGLSWLRRDAAARSRLLERYEAAIVDDAEDSEPGTGALIEMLRADGLRDIAIAISDGAAIDGIGGRRALAVASDVVRIELPPSPSTNAVADATRYADEGAEADAIARSIAELLAGGVRPDDVMVLARDAGGAAVYARLLAERGIPIAAPPHAWQEPKDVGDLLALACVVSDPYDHAHLLRVLASPLVGLSDLSLLILCRDPSSADQLALDVGQNDTRLVAERGTPVATLAENVLYGHADAALSEHGRTSLAAFRERWSQWRDACAGLSAPAAIAYLAQAAGFTAAQHAAPPHLRRRLAEDLERLVGAAAALGGASLRDTAHELEKGLGHVDPASDAGDAVTCRTILGAKGIRKPYVFVAGVAHERFPRVYVSRAMAYSKKFGLIVRENVAGGAAQSAKFAWYYAKFGAKGRYLDEERRALAYGLARANRAASASGFGKPPRWAADHDLLSAHGA